MSLFIEDFDSVAPEPEPPAPDPAACAAEYARGLADGEAAATVAAITAADAAARTLAAACATEFARAEASLAAMAEAAADQLARLVFAALDALVPSICAACGPAEQAALARLMLPRLHREPSLRLRLHPQDIGALQTELAALDSDLTDRVAIAPNPQMAPGDLRIAWQDGALLRDTGAIWRELADTLRQFGFLDPPHEAPHLARPILEQVPAHAG